MTAFWSIGSKLAVTRYNSVTSHLWVVALKAQKKLLSPCGTFSGYSFMTVRSHIRVREAY